MMTYLKQIVLFLLSSCVIVAAQPQNRGIPTIFKEPTDWRFESMPIPPGFAPDIQLKGFEETRFAPGMFQTSSSNYFTYIIVLALDGSPKVDATQLKDFVDKYYRGLSIGVGRRKNLTPDPAKFDCVVMPAKADAKHQFDVVAPFFDTFNDGRQIKLNIEVITTAKPDAKKTFVTLLISPQPKEHENWKTLREIGGKISFDSK
jgi:hypothetical protein